MNDSRGPTEVPEPLPQRCTLTTVTFVPFLVPDVGPGAAAEVELSAAVAPWLADLHLWRYSDALTAQLCERLPRRVSRSLLTPGPAPLRPGAAPAHEEYCLLDLWNVGIGLLTLVRVGPAPPSWQQLRAGLDDEVAEREFLTWAAGVARTGGPAVVAPLWAQVVLVVEVEDSSTFDSRDALAEILTAGGGRLLDGSGTRAAALRLGIEACAVTETGVTGTAAALVRVVAAQTAIWAAAINLDHQLRSLLQPRPNDTASLSLHELEVRSLELLEMFERVQRFRADVEIVPIHLGVLDKSLWQAVNTEWTLVDQLTSLDMKLGAVEHVYGHLMNAMTANRARVLNTVVLAVTMLSLASFILAGWDFARESFDPLTSLGMLVAGLAVIVSVGLFYVTARRSERADRQLSLVRPARRPRPGRPPAAR